MKKIRHITFFNQTFAMGGAETLYRQLFLWFTGQNISVSVSTTFPRFAKSLDFLPTVQIIPIRIDLIGDWKGFIKGILLLPLGFLYYGYLAWKNRFTDVIFLGGYIEKILVTPWAKLFRIPVVWLEHAPLSGFLAIFAGFPLFLYQLVKNLPDKIIVCSRYTATDLITNLHISKTKIVLIPNAVAVDQPDQKVNRHQVCCVSRLQPGKGQDLLLRAWKSVVTSVPDARLMIVGEGDFINHLTELSGSLNITDSVNFTGWVKSALEQIAASEIFVFPTLWRLEGFGLVAAEAMALGKPVVAFNFGPLPEIVTRDTGILVPAGDVSALSLALIRLLTHPDLVQKLGLAGKKRYLSEYTFSSMGPRYLEVFSHAANF
jgi:glycosyltransferase involved in cell wall biosynthesis